VEIQDADENFSGRFKNRLSFESIGRKTRYWQKNLLKTFFM
jgi:hypothetical protein